MIENDDIEKLLYDMLFSNPAWDMIPAHSRDGLTGWFEFGRKPGGFLVAVLSNNLKWAYARADSVNINCIEQYVKFLMQFAPDECWGSAGAVEDWSQKGGLRGIRNEEFQTLERKRIKA